MKLSQGDFIRLEKGMTIVAFVPKKFFCSTVDRDWFSEDMAYRIIKIGEVYKKEPNRSEFKVKIEESIKRILGYEGNISDNVDSLIESLNLNFETEEFDTAIFEGVYRIYEIKYEPARQYQPCMWAVYAEKVDNPELKIWFTQGVNSFCKEIIPVEV